MIFVSVWKFGDPSMSLVEARQMQPWSKPWMSEVGGSKGVLVPTKKKDGSKRHAHILYRRNYLVSVGGWRSLSWYAWLGARSSNKNEKH